MKNNYPTTTLESSYHDLLSTMHWRLSFIRNGSGRGLWAWFMGVVLIFDSLANVTLFPRSAPGLGYHIISLKSADRKDNCILGHKSKGFMI